jgi:hypothetical protein
MKLLRALTATRSQISLKLRKKCEVYGQSNQSHHRPQNQPLLLAVVDILLKIQNVVGSKKVATISALYDPCWWCRGSRPALAATHDKGRRWRGGLMGINGWRNLSNGFNLPAPWPVSYPGLFLSPLVSKSMVPWPGFVQHRLYWKDQDHSCMGQSVRRAVRTGV